MLALLAVLALLAPWSIEVRAEAKPAAPFAAAEEAPVDPEEQRRQFISATCTTIEAEAEPRLLLHDGAFLRKAMRKERVTEEEITVAIRQHGLDDPAAIRAVVLETDGSISVIPDGD